MGFMDKAKQLAEQGQTKLDEAQRRFSQSSSSQSQPAEGGVRYDEHGRPIEEAPPPAAAEPAAPQPPPDPASPAPPPDAASERAPAGAERHPAGPEPTRQPEPGETPGGPADTSPDPFQPLQ